MHPLGSDMISRFENLSQRRKDDDHQHDEYEREYELFLRSHDRAGLIFFIGFVAPFVLALLGITLVGLVGWAP